MSEVIFVERDFYVRALFRRLVSWCAIFVVCVILVQATFSCLGVRYTYSSSQGFVLNKNLNFTPSKGAVLLVGDVYQKHKNSIVDGLKKSLIPVEETAIVQVVSNPGGDIMLDEKDEVLQVGDDSTVTGVYHGEIESLSSSEVLAKCVEGSCPKDELVAIDLDNVIGVPVRKDFSKINEMVKNGRFKLETNVENN